MKMYISRLVIVGGNRTDVGSWYLYSQGDLLAWLYKENHNIQLVCWVPGLVVINKSSLLSPMLHSNNTLWLVKNSIVTWIIQRECIISLLCTVWPDWAIFESCWQQNFYQKKPKWLATFLAILKNLTLMWKPHWLLFWATFGKNGVTFYSNNWSHWLSTLLVYLVC